MAAKARYADDNVEALATRRVHGRQRGDRDRFHQREVDLDLRRARARR